MIVANYDNVEIKRIQEQSTAGDTLYKAIHLFVGSHFS